MSKSTSKVPWNYLNTNPKHIECVQPSPPNIVLKKPKQNYTKTFGSGWAPSENLKQKTNKKQRIHYSYTTTNVLAAAHLLILHHHHCFCSYPFQQCPTTLILHHTLFLLHPWSPILTTMQPVVADETISQLAPSLCPKTYFLTCDMWHMKHRGWQTFCMATLAIIII